MLKPDPPRSRSLARISRGANYINPPSSSLLSALLPLLRPNQQNVRWMSANNRRPPEISLSPSCCTTKAPFRTNVPSLLVAAAVRHTAQTFLSVYLVKKETSGYGYFTHAMLRNVYLHKYQIWCQKGLGISEQPIWALAAWPVLSFQY